MTRASTASGDPGIFPERDLEHAYAIAPAGHDREFTAHWIA